jgi:hypothetical protein
MAKPKKNVVQKKPGRPPTGQDPVTAIRLSAELRKRVDVWAAKQSGAPKRSEAIRRLVELGLTIKPTAKQPSPTPPQGLRPAARAKELAKHAIDDMIDESAPPQEHAQRRRQLTKGPAEFRDARLDLPKGAKGK